ncbi:cadmium efflux system accessory protein [Staphylococcus aureus]|nr:cadmium efflux system accessory protein [Staphylococcus aureus]
MSYENTCDVICVHEDKVNNALSFLEDDKSKKLLNILEKICDEKKLKIILSLIKEDELCVCDIFFDIENECCFNFTSFKAFI